MIRCEIIKLSEECSEACVNIKGDPGLILRELRSTVSEVFAGLADVMPPIEAENLMLHFLAEGLTEGADKMRGREK